MYDFSDVYPLMTLTGISTQDLACDSSIVEITYNWWNQSESFLSSNRLVLVVFFKSVAISLLNGIKSLHFLTE